MYINGSWWFMFWSVCLRFDQCLSNFFINVSLWRHTGLNAVSCNCHIGIFLCHDQCRADGMISTAGRVCTKNTNQYRNTKLWELCISIEGSTTSASVRVYQMLLIKFYTGAVQQVDQRNVQAFCCICCSQQVFCLPRYPCTCQFFIIGSNNHCPFTVDSSKTFDNAGRSCLIVIRIVQAV